MCHNAKVAIPPGMHEYCAMDLSSMNSTSVSPRVVGLTGGMGSGKSTVAGILRSFGFCVYNADDAAKSLYTRDAGLAQAVSSRFGADVFTAAGEINRKLLAARAFASKQALAELNAMVHPAVAKDFVEWSMKRAKDGARCVFREAAILFESGSHKDCHEVWAVTAPLEIRMARIARRDGLSEVEVHERMRHQWPQEEIAVMSDEVLLNDGFTPLVPQVADLLVDLF